MDLNNPTERNLSAGEYVLGTLTAEERRELEAETEKNTVLRHEIARWERQLAGLGLRLRPVAPRPMVWLNLSQRLGVAAVAAMPVSNVLWRVWAGLATAASLVLAAVLFREMSRPPPAPVKITERVEVPVAAVSYVAILQIPKSTLQWTVSITPERREMAVRAGGEAPAAAAHKDAELWWIGETGPVSLGVIPTSGELRRALPHGVKFGKGGTVAVSLEPAGGSPHPEPTGPVVTTAEVLQAN
jgi:anti-sigma-K factor RskA